MLIISSNRNRVDIYCCGTLVEKEKEMEEMEELTSRVNLIWGLCQKLSSHWN